MFKDMAGQKLTVYAFDSTTNLPKTGDAANITAYVNIDDAGTNVLADTSAAENSSANAAGFYTFDLAQAETDGNKLLFSAKSTTANIVVIGVPSVVYTDPANYTALLIDSSGRLVLSSTGLDQVVMSDITAVPAITGTLKAAINWMFALMRNKRTETATTETLFKDDGSTSVATSTKADDNTTFTRGKYS